MTTHDPIPADVFDAAMEVLAQGIDPAAVNLDGTPDLLLALSSVAQSAIEDVYADCGDSDAGVLASNVAQQLEHRITAALPRVIAAAKAEELEEAATQAERQYGDCGCGHDMATGMRMRARNYRKESE